VDLVVRAATLDDYEAMTSLYTETDRLNHEWLPQLFPPVTGPIRSRDYVARQLADPNVRYLVAELAGRIVGLLLAIHHDVPSTPWFHARRYVEVQDLTVDSAARRRGVGRLLIDATEAWARERGATSIDLTVIEANENALRFYERLGFSTRSRRMTRIVS